MLQTQLLQEDNLARTTWGTAKAIAFCKKHWHGGPAHRARLGQHHCSVGWEADGKRWEEQELPEDPVQGSRREELYKEPAKKDLGVTVDAKLNTSQTLIL